MLLLRTLLSSLLFAASALCQQQVFQAAGLPVSAFSIKSLSRTVELGGASTRSSTILTVSRNNDAAASNNEFVFTTLDAAHPEMQGKLAWLDASTGKTAASRKFLSVRGVGQDSDKHVQYFAITLPDTSGASADITVTINTIYNHASVPKPASIVQDAAGQGLYYQNDLLAGLGYTPSLSLEAGSCKIRIKSATPRSFKDITPEGWSVSHPSGSATVTYTNSESVREGQIAIASVHYEHPEPVITIPTLLRKAQVSHWGSHLSISDSMNLANSGPTLKGQFSRVRHQTINYLKKAGQAGIGTYAHVIQGIQLALPPNTYDTYYIDTVGNVSTSHFRPSPKIDLTKVSRRNAQHSLLELTPRYPIMGGWNYSFEIGYKQPLGDVLRYNKEKAQYLLAVPFVNPMKGVAVDDLELQIILPEGASNINVLPPFPISDITTSSITYTYLDTSGHPTVILKKNDITDKHSLDILVTYELSLASIARKPLVVSGVVLAGFALNGVIRRIKWTLG